MSARFRNRKVSNNKYYVFSKSGMVVAIARREPTGKSWVCSPTEDITYATGVGRSANIAIRKFVESLSDSDKDRAFARPVA